ncbi:MAG: KH domain-containing protein [Patescibacteria group bacterium]|mgnify:CR=1 FL=1
MTAEETTPGLSFITYVMEALVEEREKLAIEVKNDEQGTLITVQVGRKDMGKLIGRGGQTIKALRTLVRIVGSKLNQRINLKILEPVDGSLT